MQSVKKERIDKLLLSRGHAESRAKAQALLMAGQVYVNGERVEKNGTLIPGDAEIEVRGQAEKWVSRGAHKLLKALDFFRISPRGKICVDIGASTGGFTQVLLERGAQKVYAVDVGYGQLDWRLRNDERVIVMERTNARSLIMSSFPDPLEFAAADASFISLKLLLPVISSILSPGGSAVVLVKPQFEVGKGNVGKGGVVRAKEDHAAVLADILHFCSGLSGLIPAGLTFSPIRGPMGNIEFLLYLSGSGGGFELPSPEKTAEEAHLFFRKEG